MPVSAHVTVRIDLHRIRNNARDIKNLTGVSLLAVIKADAYGLGAARIATAIADIVDGFFVFSLAEAVEAQIWQRTGKPCRALGPNAGAGADDFSGQHVRPAVWDVDRAAALRSARPVLSVDTGMQRFSCPREQLDAVLAAGACDEAFTHATRVEHVDRLRSLVGNRGLKLHAAGSSLLHEPTAWLDAVRPGLSLYRGAARISTPLIDARKSTGPAGYSGFVTARHGVILAGYSHGLRPGPCMINNRRARIVEVGMQSAFVEIAEQDRVGDEVVLLGDELTETEIAGEWKTSPHEVLTRLCGAGERKWEGGDRDRTS